MLMLVHRRHRRHRYRLHLIIMRRVPEALRAILEQLRIQPKDERGVDAGAALAADLGRQVVQGVQVVVDDVEVALRNVFPFILEG